MVKCLALCGVLLMLAGCARDSTPETTPGNPPVDSTPSSSPSPSPSASATLPGLTPPSGPPKDPTDQIKKTDTIVGLVTRGGSGPCYGLQTDNGTEYALYSSARHELPRGKYVRLRTKTTLLRIDCGPGKPLEIVSVESIN
jgi:hypothetical protein